MTLWISACKSYSEQQQKKSIKRLHASWILVNPFPYIYTLETAVFSKAIHFPPLQCNGCSGVNLGFPWCIWSGQCCCFIFLFIWVETQFCGCGWICFQGRKWTLSAPFESWHLQELSGTFVVSLRAKCISLLIRSTTLRLHGGETLTEFKHLQKQPCVLLHQILIPLEMKPNV